MHISTNAKAFTTTSTDSDGVWYVSVNGTDCIHAWRMESFFKRLFTRAAIHCRKCKTRIYVEA